MGGRGGQSGFQKAKMPQPQKPQQLDGTQRITDPQELLKFFQQADIAQADAMLQQWRNEPLDADNRQRDTDVQRFFNYIGWTNDAPVVLNEQQYQQAVQAAGNPTQFYHSDNPHGGTGARQFAAQYMGLSTDFNGNAYRQYMSGGIHGDGTYFAPSAADSAWYGSSQYRGFLNGNAKVISEKSLTAQMSAFEKQYPAFAHVMGQMTSGYSNGRGGNRDGLQSVFAAMLGYNVIDASQHSGYHVVLNRKATTVSTKTKRARTNMKNW